MGRGCVHGAAPVDTVLSTQPGHVDAEIQQSKVLLRSPQPGGITNDLHGGGPPHDFFIDSMLEVRQSEDKATAPAVKGVKSVAK